MTSKLRLPLRGRVILDLSDEALVLGGRLLADLGADVIRVEPLAGDPLRHRGPFVDGVPGVERSLGHILYNGGKRSVALALEVPETWDILDRMLDAVDVVIAPLEKSLLAARFFDAARMAEVHPRVGVVDVENRRGGAGLPADDLTATAAGGLLYCTGFPDRAPDYPVGNLAYKQGSFLACLAAATLCLRRWAADTGGSVCISLQEAVASTTVLASNENHWRWRRARSKRTLAAGLAYPSPAPDEDLVSFISASSTTFRARDGRWVVFGFTPFTMERWNSFANWYQELTGSREALDDAWGDPVTRVTHRRTLDRMVATLCSLLPRDELVEAGQERGLMVLPVQSVADLARDPHLIARRGFATVEQAGAGRSLMRPRSPFRSSAFDPVVAPAPSLGQHTGDALEALAGMNEDEIEALDRRGLVRLASGSSFRGHGGGGYPRQRTPDGPGQRRKTAASGLPLAGYRVLDFCWMAAGPLVTEILANLGADVIKVESLARVDTLREYHHPVENATIDTGALFNDVNTGKRSITLNLATEEGRTLAHELVKRADVVTSNFTPGQMERWSLGYADLTTLRHDVIVATFPVMGSTGPRAHWRGIGSGVGAISGLSWHTGNADRPPVGLGTLQPDFTLAPLGAAQIVAALLERERNGQGQYIEISQYEGAVQLVDAQLTEYLVNSVEAPRSGNRSPLFSPHGVFRCLGDDRWVAITVRSTIEWQGLCRAMARSDLAVRADLATLAGRKAAEDEIEAAVSDWTGRLDGREIAASLRRLGVPASPLEHIGDLVDSDPGMAEFFHSFAHPAGVEFLVQHQPFTWNGARLPITRAPLLGEHNEEVFRGELELDDDRLVQLMVDRVIY